MQDVCFSPMGLSSVALTFGLTSHVEMYRPKNFKMSKLSLVLKKSQLMFGKYKLDYYIRVLGYTFINHCATLYLRILL
jgi:hypothetical protein